MAAGGGSAHLLRMPPKVAAFWRDLRRRRVFRAAAIYLVASWVVIEVSSTVFPMMGLPAWAPTFVLALVGVGLPIALGLAWAYDVGPEGITRTAPEPGERTLPSEAHAEIQSAPRTAEPASPAAPSVRPARPPARPPSDAPPRSIAVLPFVDLSRDRDQEYLGDGLAEEILNVLGRVEGLRVAARTSSFAFKGRNVDVREIGRQLGVEAVLEGSVRTAGEALRVTAQLVDVSDGYHLWSRRFDCTLANVFAVQEEIATEIAGALHIEEPAVGTGARAATESVEAYEHYLRGRHFFHLLTRRSLRVAEQMFRRSLKADGRYAPAHAGLADTCSILYMYYDASEANLRCADESSLRALEFGPEVAESHVSRGLALTLTRRFDEATEEFERALAINPRSFEAYYFHGRARYAAGDLEQAAAFWRTALEIHPESYETWNLLATLLRAAGRQDEMLEAARKGVETAERALELTPDDVRALYLGAGSLILLGDRERALEWAEQAAATDPDDNSVHYNLACFYAYAEMPEPALAHLERAVELGFAHREWVENDPDLAPLRGYERFERVLERMRRA